MGAFIKFNKGMMKMPGYETSNWCARSHLHEEKDNHDGYFYYFTPQPRV